jgi:hypothetical protein
MLAVLVQEDLLDHWFVEQHAQGQDEVAAAVRGIDIEAYCRSKMTDGARFRPHKSAGKLQERKTTALSQEGRNARRTSDRK